MEAWTLHMLGGALLRVGRLEEARDNLQEALRVFREASDTAGITLAFDDLSALAIANEDFERAARLWGAARSLVATTGANLASVVDETVEIRLRPNVRTAIAPEDLDRLAREGAAMALDDAVGYALETPVDAQGSAAD
jgi:tetratricopeptide (TPR) repeat protein